jgi:hypothetical protein
VKQATRLLFLAGAAGIALLLVRASPREVTLVYDGQGPGVRSLEVDIGKAGVAVRRAELRVPPGSAWQVSHRVRLTDGEYLLRLTLNADGVARQIEKPITVSESGTIVVPIRP